MELTHGVAKFIVGKGYRDFSRGEIQAAKDLILDTVGTLEQNHFPGSMPGPHFPLSTLRLRPRGRLRMTRGRCGSLGLHRMELPSTTLCRFLPAHHEWFVYQSFLTPPIFK